jgi:hypothetical protein
MRKLAIVMLAAAISIPGLLIPDLALGQNSLPPSGALYPSIPPITSPSELVNYCLYDNTIYSVGATICVRKQGLVCVPPPNPNVGPNTKGRAYWSATTVDTWVPPGLGQCP